MNIGKKRLIFNLEIKPFLKVQFASLIDFLFPKECVHCHKEGNWLCQDCYDSIISKSCQECYNCLKESIAGAYCHNCAKLFALDGILAACKYSDKALGHAIKAYKYKFVKDLAQDLGKLLADFYSTEIVSKLSQESCQSDQNLSFFREPILVIPVPLAGRRLRWRGFNQSALLAQYLAERFSYEYMENILFRKKFRIPQAKLSSRERQANVANNFGCTDQDIIKDRNVILVDDVATTGATLHECARILKNAGAKRIWGLVLAQG